MAALFKHSPHVHPCDRTVIPSLVFAFLADLKAYFAVNRVSSIYANTVVYSSARGKLARENKDLKDTRIIFREIDHIYLLDGTQEFPISVTGICSRFFDKFDPDRIIKKYFRTWSVNVESPYHHQILRCRMKGQPDTTIQEVIKQKWKVEGTQASRRGTYMHKQIELRLNTEVYDAQFAEMNQFEKFMTEIAAKKNWSIYRTEWSIYDPDRMIAGQIDAIFYDYSKSEYHMVDWKRSEKDFNRAYGRYGMIPCHTLLDNRFNQYALQQNLYAVLLCDCYNIHLASMSLVQLHETQETYKMHTVRELPMISRKVLNMSIKKRVLSSDNHECLHATKERKSAS